MKLYAVVDIIVLRSNGLFMFNIERKLLPTDILSGKLKSLIPFNLTSFLRLFLLNTVPHLTMLNNQTVDKLLT